MPRPEDYKAPKGTRKVYPGAKPRTDFAAGSVLLRKLQDLNPSSAFSNFEENVQAAEAQGQGLGDVLGLGSSPQWSENIFPGLAQAEAEGQNLFDILSGGIPSGPVRAPSLPQMNLPDVNVGMPGGPVKAPSMPQMNIPDVNVDLPSLNMLNPMAGMRDAIAAAEAQGLSLADILIPGLPRAGDIPGAMPASPVMDPAWSQSPEPNMSFGQALESALNLWPVPILKTGEMVAGGLGFGPEEAGATAGPQFDLQAALSGLQPTPPVSGSAVGNIPGGLPPGGAPGLDVLSQVVGPAAVLPAPVQEPLPPELDLAHVRTQYMQGRPRTGPSATLDYMETPEQDLEALQHSYALQGIGEGAMSRIGGPVHEMWLGAGFGGLSGMGQGMRAREDIERLDREQMMALREEDRERRREEEEARSEFEKGLAGLDLSIAETELAADVARTNAMGQNLDRQYQHALAQAKLGAPQFLGMSSAGPVMMSTKDGKQSIHVVQTPTSEVDRMSAMAELMSAEAKMAEAKGKKDEESYVDPSLAGFSSHLATVGEELIRTGGYTQLFDEDTLGEIMETVNNKLGSAPMNVDDKTTDRRFNQVLIAEIVQRLYKDPNLIPQASQFSTMAAQLSMAEELARGNQ